MPNINLVIFDMDGLMFDTEPLSYKTWVSAAKQLGYEFPYTFFETLIGSNYEKTKILCLAYFGNDFPYEKAMILRRSLTKETILREGTPIKQGLLNLLDYLDVRNIKKAVATSSGRERAMLFLDNAHITDRFDTILCGDEVTKSKPDPEIFLNVVKKFQFPQQSVMVLEDSIVGIKAAISGGLISVMIPDLVKPDDETHQNATKVLQSLWDVPEFMEVYRGQ